MNKVNWILSLISVGIIAISLIYFGVMNWINLSREVDNVRKEIAIINADKKVIITCFSRFEFILLGKCTTFSLFRCSRKSWLILRQVNYRSLTASKSWLCPLAVTTYGACRLNRLATWSADFSLELTKTASFQQPLVSVSIFIFLVLQFYVINRLPNVHSKLV